MTDANGNAPFTLDNGDPNYFGPQFQIDLSDQEPEVQPPLPGLRRAVGWPKRDWRKWRDAMGQKVDAAPYRGRMSSWGGKIIPLPVDLHGKPLVLGHFQVMMRGDGYFIVVDWSKPLGENVVYISPNGLRSACRLAGMFHRWERWQGPLRKNQSRHKTVFGVEQKLAPPAPPQPKRFVTHVARSAEALEADPVLSSNEDEDTVNPLVRKLLWGE